MMRPKKTKYAKYQKKLIKIKKKRGCALQWKTNKLKFGDYGLRAIESGFLNANQIEATRQVITRKLKRQGQIWIRIFPSIAVTSKPIEVRMGKGKGNVDFWGTPIKAGQVLFELTGVDKSIAEVALKHGSGKLPFKTQIIYNLYK